MKGHGGQWEFRDEGFSLAELRWFPLAGLVDGQEELSLPPAGRVETPPVDTRQEAPCPGSVTGASSCWGM